MNKRPILRYAAVITALRAFVMAARVSYTTATEPRAGFARMLPGAPLPNEAYFGLLSDQAPVRKVSEALATPFQAAAERLRPLARAIFPSLWEATPQEKPDYNVRDSALRVVKGSL